MIQGEHAHLGKTYNGGVASPIPLYKGTPGETRPNDDWLILRSV